MSTIDWKFEIGDAVCTKAQAGHVSALNKLARAAQAPYKIQFPVIMVIIARKYDECHGGCGQKQYTVHVRGDRFDVPEPLLMQWSEALTQCEDDYTWAFTQMKEDSNP